MKMIGAIAGLTAILLAATGTSAATNPAPAKSSPAKPAPAKSTQIKSAPVKSAPAKPTPAKPSKQAAKPIKSVAVKSAPHPAAKQAAQTPAKPAAIIDPGPQKVAYPDGVTALRDLTYATLPGFRPLTLDLYQPKRAPKDFPKPLLIFVHGGGWSSGDARHGGGFDDFPTTLAAIAKQQNDIVASINYRLSGEAHFPAALQDVKSAIRWLRAHADEYDIDVTRVAIWGEEAGGQLAALAGTSCGVATLEPQKTNNAGDEEPSDCVQAVIDWHGITDLATLAADSGRVGPADATNAPSPPSPEGAYLGCEPAACPPGFVKTTSPLTYIGANSPPFLIQHGAHKDVPLSQSQKLFDALTAAHVPVEQATYTDTDTDVAKQSIDKLEAFLDQTFPRKPVTAAKAPPPRPKSGALPY